MRLRTLQEDWKTLKKFASINGYPNVDKDFIHNYKKKKFSIRIIEDKNIPIGFLIWKKNKADKHFNEDYIYLDVIFLENKSRKKGYGKRILSRFEDFVKIQNIKIISFGVEKNNIPAISLYENLGYKKMKVSDVKHYGFYKFLC